MRIPIIAAVALLSACSDGTDGTKPKAETRAAQLDGGQWETTQEVTQMRQTDNGAPAIKAAVGSKTTTTLCIAEEERAAPPPALFVGDAGTCSYQNSYVRNGKLNAGIRCNRPGMRGDIMSSVEGSFKADSFEGTMTTTSYLVSDGDVQISAKISGRRVGACTAGGETPAKKG